MVLPSIGCGDLSLADVLDCFGVWNHQLSTSAFEILSRIFYLSLVDAFCIRLLSAGGNGVLVSVLGCFLQEGMES